MINYLSLGRIIFAISFIALSIQGMIMHDFNFGRPPAWPDNTARVVWSFIAGAIVIIACVAILLKRKADIAALVIAALIFISIFLARNVPALLSGDLAGAFWSLNAFKTLALAGGACVVAASFWSQPLKSWQKGFLWFGVITLAYWLFVAGLSHFKFVDFIRGGFIPAYIPFQTFWTYFTGVCLLAGGVGLMVKPVRSLAAVMSGFMILGWFFLLHLPRLAVSPTDMMEWFGVWESLGFVGIFYTLGAVLRTRTDEMSSRGEGPPKAAENPGPPG
jgi:uncharacterized membrane protein